MSRYRYDAAQKLQAVRHVVEEGRSVVEVARAMGVSEGSVFFWVRRYRQFAADARASQPAVDVANALRNAFRESTPSPQLGSLVAYLRRSRAA